MVGLPQRIPTGQLRISDVPDISASWDAIGLFALTFDRSEKNPYEIEDQDFKLWTERSTLVDLRARLFVEQRRWNHFHRYPDDETMNEVRRLVRLIRGKVPNSSSDRGGAA